MKINEKDLSYIINCEKSSIIFDSPLSYSIEKIGEKSVMVKTKRKEKTRITALLTIC